MSIGTPFSALPDVEKIERLRHGFNTLTTWLVAAQTGISDTDAQQLRNIVECGQSKVPPPPQRPAAA
jgi:hypothetical protein